MSAMSRFESYKAKHNSGTPPKPEACCPFHEALQRFERVVPRASAFANHQNGRNLFEKIDEMLIGQSLPDCIGAVFNNLNLLCTEWEERARRR